MTTPAIPPDPTPESIWRMLGLAKRAGKMVCGSDAVEKAARKGQVWLLILSGDAGPNTTGRLEQVGRVTGTPLLTVGDRQTLGHWTGKDERVVVGLTDQGFADRIMALANFDQQQKSE